MMKLSKWAKEMGISYKTALAWVKNSTLPANVKANIMPTGTILIEKLEVK